MRFFMQSDKTGKPENDIRGGNKCLNAPHSYQQCTCILLRLFVIDSWCSAGVMQVVLAVLGSS